MKASPQLAAKTERLLNLVICLLYTRRPLTKEQIRGAVTAYQDTSDEAFARMFERDKEELRALGIPISTQQLDSFFDDEPGYRIDQREYSLPEVSFTRDELTVLGLASRAWAQASLAGPATLALTKLAAAGVERDDATLVGVEPRVRTVEPAFEPIRQAVLATQPIRFTYAKPDGSASERHLQPWAIAAWRGRWYVTGYDTDKASPRVFRLSRIQGGVHADGAPSSYQVPPDHKPTEMISAQVEASTPVTAVLAIKPGRGHALRRHARPDVEPAPSAPSGWDTVCIMTGEIERLAQEVASFGPDVLALAPADLVQSVVRRLRAAADAHAFDAGSQ